ncbi:MAG TPA: FAD-linked oxidase C-terminal domain-containing protein, partial [Myxococcota bacterium]|nr:FAD-linked oxidase C-terminal domain-containing protein [Myxococcota bacterium]
ACLWKDLPLLYARVRQAISRHAVVMAHFSHAYREGCSIYFTFAGVGDVTIYDALWKDALDAADSVGATVAHHHGVGQLKQQAAGRELAGLAPLYQQIKKRLDPAGIMNPGRIFPAVRLPPVRVEAPSVDPVSLVAHLSPDQPAAERDRWLADQGVALRFPAAGPLREHIAGPQAPWETRIVGCVAQLPHGRFRIKAVPRSAAGPDLRALLPASAYEQLVVPLVRLSEPRWEGSVSENTLRNMDIRASRHLADGRVEILGPAAPELGELIRRQIER